MVTIRKSNPRTAFAATGVALALLFSLGAYGQGCDPTYVTREGNTFVVSPTGADDTANLQCAFNEAALAGAGARVQLACGTFTTNMIDVTGFHGTFAGMGQDMTVIHSAPNLPCDQVLWPDWPSLFVFRLSDLQVEDLSFQILDPAPCLPWWGSSMGLGVILFVTDLPADITGCADPLLPSPGSAIVNRVSFEGLPGGGPYSEYAVAMGFQYSPQCYETLSHFMKGDVRIQSSRFDHMAFAAVLAQVTESKFLFGGAPPLKNTVSDVNVGVYCQDLSASAAEISYNDIAAQWANIFADQYYYRYDELSTFLVTHNTLHVDAGSDGVGLADYLSKYYGQSLKAEVSFNDFAINTDCCGGIVGYYGTRDVLVRNNRFHGTAGWYGIRLGYSNYHSDEGWLILGNDFQNLSAGVAPIWLGRTSKNCTVVGGSNKTNVYNQGVGNTLTGVNNMQGNPPGPDVSEGLQGKVNRIPPR